MEHLDNYGKNQLTLMNLNLLITKSISDSMNLWTLTSRIGEMLELAIDKFGEINSDYFFLGIELKDDGPRIQYLNPKYIIIQLTPSSLNNEYMALYQLSHEVYHLLSPTGKYDANNLEEGLAVYFSKLYLNRFNQNIFNWETATQSDNRYYNAYNLVRQILEIEPNIIKDIRSKFPEIKTSHLTIDEFKEVMPESIPIEIINELLEPFPHRPSSDLPTHNSPV